MPGDEFGVDLAVLFGAVDNADVLIIRFPFFEKRLLVDYRNTQHDPPVVTLVPQASAIEERFRSVKQARPRLPVPDKIVSFQWPRHVVTLRAAGVWQRIVDRLLKLDQPNVRGMCDRIWAQMLAEERREEIEAIRGSDRYDTLWEREPGPSDA